MSVAKSALLIQKNGIQFVYKDITQMTILGNSLYVSGTAVTNKSEDDLSLSEGITTDRFLLDTLKHLEVEF